MSTTSAAGEAGRDGMPTSRLEAFSDGVLAIIITIMVLELEVPDESSWAALRPLGPVVASYVLSFAVVGIYWNNHHHLLQASRVVNGAVLWANLHLLFWLSLLPFTTAWMGENDFERAPTLLYGIDLLACAIAYYVLQTTLVRLHGRDSSLVTAIGRDAKGKMSPVIYAIGLAATAFVSPWIGLGCYLLVTLIWLVPDRRLENSLARIVADRPD